MVVRVDVGTSDEEHAQDPVEPDEGYRQVRGRGPEGDERGIGRPPDGSPMRLVGEKAQEASQDPAHAFPLLGGVGLDHEPWHADRRRVEETAAVIRHDTTEQPEGAPEPGFVMVEEILAAPHIGVRHVTPMYRGFRTDSQSWGWDRADNLHDTYDLLTRVEPGRIAGFVLAFRTLPGLNAATAMMVFAAGTDRDETERAV